MSITALKTLVESSKATVMLGVLLMLGAMLYLKTIDAAEFLGAIKVIVPAWLIAHAGERGAKHLAANGNKRAPSKAENEILAALQQVVEDTEEDSEKEKEGS